MSKFAIRLLTLAILSLALAAAPVFTAVYAAPDNDPPTPPPPTKGSSAGSIELRREPQSGPSRSLIVVLLP